MIIFEPHATTVDNEADRAAGWNDVALSEIGQKQAAEMGERYRDTQFDVVFCSDLQRSRETARIAFGDRYPVVVDARLRECNYGEMNGAPKHLIEDSKAGHITSPFPGGESYADCLARMHEFLGEIANQYGNDARILIIGHRATQYGLEVELRGVQLETAVTAPWQWQPGWQYVFNQKTDMRQQ